MFSGLYVETAAVAQRFLAELCQAYAEMARRLDALAILDCVEVREARLIGRWRPEWLMTDSPCPRRLPGSVRTRHAPVEFYWRDV